MAGTIEKIGEYKMEILNELVNSDKLSKLIHYNVPDALFQPSLSEEEKQSLIYTKVFPYRFNPNPVEDQGTFLTIGVGRIKNLSGEYRTFNDYRIANIYFYLFTHMDLMRTHAGVRQDAMLSEIDKIFDGKNGVGIGALAVSNVDELWIHNNKFGGYTVTLSVVDLR